MGVVGAGDLRGRGQPLGGLEQQGPPWEGPPGYWSRQQKGRLDQEGPQEDPPPCQGQQHLVQQLKKETHRLFFRNKMDKKTISSDICEIVEATPLEQKIK